jgi:hypothetical protein
MTLSPRDPQQVPKPKYEATARQAHLNIGYTNSTTGSMDNSTALLTCEATSEALRPTSTSPPISPRLEPRLTVKNHKREKAKKEKPVLMIRKNQHSNTRNDMFHDMFHDTISAT